MIAPGGVVDMNVVDIGVLVTVSQPVGRGVAVMVAVKQRSPAAARGARMRPVKRDAAIGPPTMQGPPMTPGQLLFALVIGNALA